MTVRLRSTGIITLVALAERTVTGQGAAVPVALYKDDGKAILLANSVSGAGRTLDVSIEDSADGSTGWAATGLAFSQVGTADADEAIDVYLDGLRGFIRAAWTIAGTTPVYRFGVAFLAR